MLAYPKHYLLSSGIGADEYPLVAFDSALLSAGISNYNLLKVSSILPRHCEPSPRLDLREGSALLVAYSSVSTEEEGALIASAVAVGIPEDPDQVGVIMECSGHYDAQTADRLARDMAERAMRNHGIPLKEIRSSSIEAVGTGGKTVTVISALSLW